jgi:multiple sugar transport system substrate-binding protein
MIRLCLPFRSLAAIGRLAGYAGPSNRAAAEVVTKYIIADMYAKGVQGMPAEDAVTMESWRRPVS